MRRLLSAGAVACAIATSLAGCYWLASYEDLTSAWGTVDGATGPADAGPADARPDADARPAAEAAGPFCPPDAGPLVYCMDFDGVDAGAIGVGSYQADAAIVDGVFVSPPSSLFVACDGKGASGGYYVDFPFQPSTTTLQFDVKAPVIGQWVTLLAIVLHDDATNTRRVLNAVVSPDEQYQVQEWFGLADGGNENAGHPAVPLDGGAEAGAWHHVVLSLAIDPASGKFVSGLTVDGQPLEVDYPLALSWAKGNAHLGVGVTYGGGAGPRFYFDNVRADFGL